MPDDKFQYVVFAAEPYENIAFKVPNMEIDITEGKYFINWDKDKKEFIRYQEELEELLNQDIDLDDDSY